MGRLPSGLEHDARSLPGDASNSILHPVCCPSETRFPRHETRCRVSEQLFVVLAGGVGYHDERDAAAAHVGGWSRVCSGGDGKSLLRAAAGLRAIEVAGFLWLLR